MKKCRSYSLFQRTLSLILSLSMTLSVVAEIDLLAFFAFAGNISAAPAPSTSDPDEYANETLLYRWEHDNDNKYVNAARPLYTCRDGSFGGVEKRTIFHVYAFEGDTICIGSSVADSMIDINFSLTKNTKDKGSVDVVMTDLKGVKHPIDIRYEPDTESGETKDGFVQTGFIENPGVELAALNMKKVDGKFTGTAQFDDGNGEKTYTYTPYTYTVTETGVYTFEFYSYNKGTGGTSYCTATYIARKNLSMPSTATNHKFNGKDATGWIAALNLTVFDESGVEQHGRTYADFLSMEMGEGSSNGVRDAYYILTKDSYIYKMQFNNVSPYTYNFFSNNKGIYDPDSTNGDIIYKSVKDINNDNTFDEMGVEFRYPGTKDTDMLKSYYIFLEYPDDQLEGRLYEKAVQPDPATNLYFAGTIDKDGKLIPGAYTGQGGYFVFDVEEATTATLRLEFNGMTDEDGNPYAPVEISKAVTPHSKNYFLWNGKDGNGKVIRKGEYNLDNIAFTITTKAGEIHFPIIDMEVAREGITFTRMSHIYDKEGKQLDSKLTEKNNIYDWTRNVIYYDDSAIYYGEKLTPTSAYSESEVVVAKDFFAGLKPEDTKRYWEYSNVRSGNNGGEYYARQSGYIKNNADIRVGDHSHTTNVIDYFKSDGELITTPDATQQNMIKYLDSKEYPVGKTNSSGGDGKSSTSDYGIANFWTFVPAKPAKSEVTEQTITIADPDENYFVLTGRVFFDANKNGKLDSMSTAGDYPLKDVTLNLYKKSNDTEPVEGKKYVSYNAATNSFTEVNESNFSTLNLYERVDTAQTTGDGSYKFTGLNYDPVAGTEYIYEVKSPGSNYELTSSSQSAAPSIRDSKPFGYYADKSYGSAYKGTAVQHIVVGGSNGVDPTKMTYTKTDPNPTHTVCAVDVGYYYETLDQTLEFKKVWDEPEKSHPDAVAYKVCYKLQKNNTVKTYAYPVLSAINSWQYTYTYPHSEDESGAVDNYYVDSEYYIKDVYIYKHTFEYDASSGKYTTFVGKSYRADLESLNEIVDKFNDTTGTADVKTFSNIPDLALLDELTWEPLDESGSPYKAVIDRNFGSDTISVTITNAVKHGTIEIFKYHDTVDETNALQGATFRVYELPSEYGSKVEEGLNYIKQLVAASNTTALGKLQVGSDTTRSNGRIAFPGLDSSKNYVVREMYAPAGYRILNEFYVVKLQGKTLTEDEQNSGIYYVFNEDNYAELEIGNAPADKNFNIIKQIEGRSWQDADTGIDADSFSFNISNAFDSSIDNISEADGIIIDPKEQEILKSDYADEAAIKEALGKFAKHFQEGGDENTVTISYTNNFYKYTAKDINNHEYTFEYPDRKVSEPLLDDGKAEGANASFRNVPFPMAGVYTFTIKENDINITGDGTLTKSPLEYTVKINVTRELTAGIEEGTEIDKDNSHLVAEISSITYRDTTDSSSLSQVFAGSSPLFTNKYAPAPAKQSTSYAIEKNFFSKPDDVNWAKDGSFTVSVSGEDTETQNAIKNGNLVINGTGFTLAAGASEWTHTFTKTNQGAWKFDSFTFKDIVFPVQYVHNGTKEPWNPDEHGGQEYPPELEKEKYTIETLPVTYWLVIKEDIPEEVNDDKMLNGITYDDTVYYLEIILRNTEEHKEGTDSEEEDGIIDEMDLNLYKDSKDTKNLVADCKTVQTVVTEAEGWDPSITEEDGKTVTWWYLTKDKQLIQYTESIGTPSNHYKLIKKTESHKDNSDDGHTMTINNEYNTIYTWQPQIEKTLKGREWRSADEFTFTLTCETAPDNVKKEDFKRTITITNDTEEHKAFFETLTFTVPGEYTFKIVETSKGESITTTVKDTESGEYTVTVKFEDSGDGTLKPTFNGNPITLASLIVFNNVYADEDKSFDLAISKQIVGRDWNDKDEFTFTITPDTDTKSAIENKYLDMSEIGTQNTDGSYKVTVRKSDVPLGTTVTDTVVKTLGEIKIKEVTEDKTQYKFTITENTPPDNMHCLESSIDLYVNVNRVLNNETNLPTGELEVSSTYAYMTSGSTKNDLFYKDTVNPKATIPFVNLCMGKLTVAKKVVSSTGSTQLFDFKVKFTFEKDAYTEKMKAVHSNTGADVSPLTDGTTYTFKLSDGEYVTFTDIPPNTKYTVSEITGTMPTGYMFLRIEDNNNSTLSSTASISDNINGESNKQEQYLVFVNGEIKELPSAGGSGTGTFVVLGAAIMAVASVMLIAVWYIRRKKTEREEQRS